MRPDVKPRRREWSPSPPSAGALLRACPLAATQARALLAHALGVSREHLIAHPEAAISEPARANFARLVADRLRGMPMAYLLGVQEFFGYPFGVSPAVLIPRPDTELLVESALGLLQNRPGARVLELGTGSGCIAICLALARPDLLVVASDCSPAALQVARQNSLRLGASVHLVGGDWYSPIDGRFDLIVSNPPYIAAADAHLAALSFEPRPALTDEGDGRSALRIIIGGAPKHLEPGGALLVEHGYDQGAAARELLRESGFARVQTLRDLAGQERACIGATDAGETRRPGLAEEGAGANADADALE